MFPKIFIKIVNALPEKYSILISKLAFHHKLKKYANLNVIDLHNLDHITTPTVFVCNHLSNSDGVVLSKVLKKIDPTFLAGIKLSDNEVTKLGISIVKTTNINPNGLDTAGLKHVINLVKSGESILIFPEGTRSRTGSLIEAKKGISLIVQLTGAPIVPVSIIGSEKLLPIDLDGNMENEIFQHADVTVRIGKQFSLAKMQKVESKKEYENRITQQIMHKIAALLPESYRGFYQ